MFTMTGIIAGAIVILSSAGFVALLVYGLHSYPKTTIVIIVLALWLLFAFVFSEALRHKPSAQPAQTWVDEEKE